MTPQKKLVVVVTTKNNGDKVWKASSPLTLVRFREGEEYKQNQGEVRDRF